MDKLKIIKCKSTHGRFNLDNGNVIIEVDVELDTKKITKDIAIKVEQLLSIAPKLLYSAKQALSLLKELPRPEEESPVILNLEKVIAEAEGKV